MIEDKVKLELQSIILKQIKKKAMIMLSGHALNYLSLEQYIDEISNQLVYVLKTTILGETFTKEQAVSFLVKFDTMKEIDFPATWWQMFKKDYFPEKLLIKFPVKYTKHKIPFNLTKTIIQNINIDAEALYPKLLEIFPEERQNVVIRGYKINPNSLIVNLNESV